MRDLFYLDNLIVMARSREWCHTARLMLHLSRLEICQHLEEVKEECASSHSTGSPAYVPPAMVV